MTRQEIEKKIRAEAATVQDLTARLIRAALESFNNGRTIEEARADITPTVTELYLASARMLRLSADRLELMSANPYSHLDANGRLAVDKLIVPDFLPENL